MRFYRIKQIAKDAYIPQVRTGFFGSWNSISKENNLVWFSNELVSKYCVVETFNEAREIVRRYERIVHKKEQYPIYHKL